MAWAVGGRVGHGIGMMTLALLVTASLVATTSGAFDSARQCSDLVQGLCDPVK
jgi:hypothetical protein